MGWSILSHFSRAHTDQSQQPKRAQTAPPNSPAPLGPNDWRYDARRPARCPPEGSADKSETAKSVANAVGLVSLWGEASKNATNVAMPLFLVASCYALGASLTQRDL